MWQQRLKIGTYFRIGVYVHWTFALLVLYAAYAGYQDGLAGALYSVSLLVGMFLCVTLHEYGHALTARRFGIETLDITLLPIGGVARLLRIPRIPWQEFLVAVAGPAVNVVILAVIGGLLFIMMQFGMWGGFELAGEEAGVESLTDSLDSPSLLGYLLFMMLVNTMLILFNMIPAFPMDGGRVLRSVLASFMDYRKATRAAFVVGVFCAIAMTLLAIYYNRPMAGLVAVFICYAGLTEARQVDAVEPLRGLTVGDAMIHSPPRLSMDMPLFELIELLRSCPTRSLPVVGYLDVVTGMLQIDDVAKAVTGGQDPSTTVGQLARHDAKILAPDATLDSVISGPPIDQRQFAVADAEGRLIGLLDLDSLRARIQMLRRGV